MSSQTELLSSPSKGTTARASSVLNKNFKLYGPMNAIDTSNRSSCWNSDGTGNGNGRISFFVEFHRIVIVEELRLQFQGGFVGDDCRIYSALSNTAATVSAQSYDNSVLWRKLSEGIFELDDSNEIQIFSLMKEDEVIRRCNMLRFDFTSSTDFYGRIILYLLEVWGIESE